MSLQQQSQNKGQAGDFVNMYEGGFGGGIFLLTHSENPDDKMFVRIIGKDAKGRVEFDMFRVYPEIDASRYGVTSEQKALTEKQFAKRFKAYRGE